MDGEIVIEDGDVGEETRFEFAEPLEAEGLSLVPGGGLDELMQRQRDEFGDIAHAFIEAQGGTGQGAAVLEAGGTVFDHQWRC